MQNKYFGDENDYKKYGLLRILQSNGNCKLLVVWMLTNIKGDKKRDGEKRKYLDKKNQEVWKRFDPKLYVWLCNAPKTLSERNVSFIENAKPMLLHRTSFYPNEVPDKPEDARKKWLDDLKEKASGVDFVFFDPDNGIEIKSKHIGQKGSSKYVTKDEIREIWKKDSSILIYQHFRHKKHEIFIKDKINELRGLTNRAYIRAFKTNDVLYLLAIQKKHKALVQKNILQSKTGWKDKNWIMEAG